MFRLARFLPTLLFALSAGAGLFATGCENTIAVGCATDAECGAGSLCVEGMCTEAETCITDADCVGGVCSGGICDGSLRVGDGDGDSPVGDGDGDADSETVGDAQVRVTPSESEPIDFGSPVLGVGIERTVSVENVGEGSMVVTSAVLSEATSDEYALTAEPPLPATLEPGDRAELTIIYTLADGEEDQGVLEVVTDAASCDASCADPSRIGIALITEFKGARNLNVAPEFHDFGYVPAQTVSAAKSLLIENDGSLDKLLTVTGISVDGDVDAFDYALPELPLFIAPGQSVEVPVTYNPAAPVLEQSVTFTVDANSDDPTLRELSSTMVGTSQPPNALVFDPPEVEFPELALNQTAQGQSVLRNIGGTAIEVSALTLGAQNPVEYSYVAYAGGAQVVFPRTLLPGDEITIYVDYVALTGAAAFNTITAYNDQPSGQAPVLNLRGESYIPPGGPVLDVVMSPETMMDTSCVCQGNTDVSAANVDISYRSVESGATCAKPADMSCGLDGANCDCPALNSYGDVNWGGALVTQVSGQTWIVDETVHHEGEGQDGKFVVEANLIDDCLAVPGGSSYDIFATCVWWMDCDAGVQTCFEYSSTAPICSVDAPYFATRAWNQGCLARGPVAVRTVVKVSQDNGLTMEDRHFCTTLGATGASADVVTLNRFAGYFTIDSVAPGVLEVGPNETCPAP